MLREILIDLYERDLGRLKAELELYPSEADLWKKPGDVPNSAGNLSLHLIGNLQHFFGAVLAETGYVRDRPLEFSATDVPREKILADIEVAREVVTSTLANFSDDDLSANYPIDQNGQTVTTGWYLTHLALHLSWHLGQINYLRRML